MHQLHGLGMADGLGSSTAFQRKPNTATKRKSRRVLSESVDGKLTSDSWVVCTDKGKCRIVRRDSKLVSP